MNSRTRDIIQSFEARLGVSEAIGTLLEQNLNTIGEREFFKKIRPSVLDRAAQVEVIRRYCFLVLEFLLDRNYENPPTKQDVYLFLTEVLEETGNPYRWSASDLNDLVTFLVVEVYRNKGRLVSFQPHPLTQPKETQSVPLLKMAKRRSEHGLEQVLELPDEWYQFLYRKKEIDGYLGMSYYAMVFREAVKKGNYSEALQHIVSLDKELRQLIYLKVPQLKQRMAQDFESTHRERTALVQDGFRQLQATHERIARTQPMIQAVLLGMEEEVNHYLKDVEYDKKKASLQSLERNVEGLLNTFSEALSAIQVLNDYYNQLLDEQEIVLIDHYLSIKEELLTPIAHHSIQTFDVALQQFLAPLWLEEHPRTYSYDRLLHPPFVKSREKEKSVAVRVLRNDTLAKQLEAEEREREQQQAQEVSDLLAAFLTFAVTRRETSFYLSEFLMDLKTHHFKQYIHWTAQHENGVFYRFVLLSLYPIGFQFPSASRFATSSSYREQPYPTPLLEQGYLLPHLEVFGGMRLKAFVGKPEAINHDALVLNCLTNFNLIWQEE